MQKSRFKMRNSKKTLKNKIPEICPSLAQKMCPSFFKDFKYPNFVRVFLSEKKKILQYPKDRTKSTVTII